MSKVFVATRLEEQTNQALKVIAAKQDRTVAYLLRKAAEQFVNDSKGRGTPQTDRGRR